MFACARGSPTRAAEVAATVVGMGQTRNARQGILAYWMEGYLREYEAEGLA